jgi:hypothetical protein
MLWQSILGFVLFNLQRKWEKFPSRFKEDDTGDYLSDFLVNHSASIKPRMDNTMGLLWFLNLASRYRNMHLKQEHLLFNFEKMVVIG